MTELISKGGIGGIFGIKSKQLSENPDLDTDLKCVTTLSLSSRVEPWLRPLTSNKEMISVSIKLI